MRVGLITGSGGFDWPALGDPRTARITTEHGAAEVTIGRVGDVEVVHLSRHGAGHARLSNQVTHKANLAALTECQVEALISLTVCGALDPAIATGSLIAFDDLHFLANRLPDGSICSWYDTPGQAGRGHWIFDSPFSAIVRTALLGGARDAGAAVVDGGCYGHVDGPRFNTRSEIAALRAAGVCAVSQTAGPEVVLAGEMELPMALLGFVTDHANGVSEPLPVEHLIELMGAGAELFSRVVSAALTRLGPGPAAGLVYRFGS